MDIYKVLKELNISYEEVTHKAIFTVEEGKEIDRGIEGTSCKNLFSLIIKNILQLNLLINQC